MSSTESPEAQNARSVVQPTRDKLYIGGAWVASTGTGSIDVVNPATEVVIGAVPDGTPADIDAAVTAAEAALDGWSRTPVAERVALCTAVSERLRDRGDELAVLIASELGMPVKLSGAIQAGMPTMTFGSMAKLVDEVAWEEELGNSLIVREAAGVVGAITPWNYPLHQIAAKVAPALAAGCTVVLKPSEVTPLNAFVLAEVFDEVGLPAGVFNLVTGTGPVVGAALAAHPGVDVVTFTGSTAAGKLVSEAAAATVKRVALELGGKSANVILDDADLQPALVNAVQKCFLNSGQTCSALTRLLVPRALLPTVEAIVKEVAESVVVGDPFTPGTQLGPLVSEVQRDRVRDHITRAIADGARVVTGGAQAPDGLQTGFYVRPTVFSDVTPEMAIARDEVFGPVLVLLGYDDEDDAVRIANDSDYGLAGGVWSSDEARAMAVARRMRTGQVEINGGAFNLLAPFGGVKQSGHGRENGRLALDEFLSVKAMQR